MSNLFGCSRVLAVGDIHGMYEKLIALMEQIRFTPGDDMLVFLGDYIDRGPDSVKCLQYVYDLQRRYPDSVVCLMGNHEVMLSSYFLQKKGIHTDLMKDFADSWLENGGLETLQQLNELDASTRETLVNWVTDLPVQFRYQEFFFCHAGIDADMALDRQTDFDLLWKRRSYPCAEVARLDRKAGAQAAVFGKSYYPVRYRRIYERRPPQLCGCIEPEGMAGIGICRLKVFLQLTGRFIKLPENVQTISPAFPCGKGRGHDLGIP